MTTKYPLDEKLDSSADQIDDIETQQERVVGTYDNNVGGRRWCQYDERMFTFHRRSKSMSSTRRRRNAFFARLTFA